MPRIDSSIEKDRHYHAYTVYRDMGPKRSLRATAKLVKASVQSVCEWAKKYKWDDRIQEYAVTLEERKEQGDLLPIMEDPAAEKIVRLLHQIEAIIDNAFVPDISGKVFPKKEIKIESIGELTKLVAEYRQLLETYHEFLKDLRPKDRAEGRANKIEKFTAVFMNTSQEERIAMMKGVMRGNAVGGHKATERDYPQRDSADVSESGDDDGLGRDGVPDGPTDSGSGDEEGMQ